MAKKDKKPAPLWRTVIEAITIAVVIHTFLFRPFFIPSSSMKPNLLIGDYLVINKFSYGFSCYSPYIAVCDAPGRVLNIFGGVKRGDVVVFSNPSDNRPFVKRVIGLPGDQIQMKQSQLYINGEAIPYEPVEEFSELKTDYLAGRGNPKTDAENYYYQQFEQRLPEGKTFNVLNYIDNARLDTTDVFTVPEGQYFVMGDNRDDSDDSRGVVGYLPEARLIGKAKLIVFSSAGSSLFQIWKWRSDRLFKWVE